MARQRATAPISSGIGESIPHAAAFTDPDYIDYSDPRYMGNCTLGGEMIPEHLWTKIPYAQTDQGMAEREEETRNDPKPTPGLEFLRDEVSNGIRRRGGDLDRGMDSPGASGVVTGAAIERGVSDDDAFDPRRELVLRHVPQGMRPKFLSHHEVGADGQASGGYQVCMDGAGKPVRHGTSFLGYIPEHRALAIQARFEGKSHAAQAEMYSSDLLQQEKALRGGSPLASFERPDPGNADLGLQSGSFGGDD